MGGDWFQVSDKVAQAILAYEGHEVGSYPYHVANVLCEEICLRTGAKLHKAWKHSSLLEGANRFKGGWVVSGYSQDHSDTAPYKALKETLMSEPKKEFKVYDGNKVSDLMIWTDAVKEAIRLGLKGTATVLCEGRIYLSVNNGSVEHF